MATVKPSEDELFIPDGSDGAQYAITTIVIVAIVILVLIVLIKFCYLRRLSGKNFQNAERIRTISENIRDGEPPPYSEILCTFTTSEDGTIQICIPESPPYIKDPPPYNP